MDNTKQIIALQKLLTTREIMTLVVTCEKTIKQLPQNASQWLQVIQVLRAQNKISRDISFFEMQKALSDAQRIVDESMEEDIRIISYNEEDYPQPLSNILVKGKYDYPLVLYYKGNIKNVSQMEAIAIIGTRNPSSDGLKMGEYYGEYFAKEGFNIVSGLAMGCDAAAHRGALKAKGVTTAFVAHGLDTVYPPQNEALAEKIIAFNGAIISEYPIGTPVGPQNLVERNRLQAGLADAVILVQTDIKKGGSMHAVNIAIANKKPVFAVQFEKEQANSNPMTLGNLKLINEKKAIALTPGNAGKVIEAIDAMNN
jgi:DNA processing protein